MTTQFNPLEFHSEDQLLVRMRKTIMALQLIIEKPLPELDLTQMDKSMHKLAEIAGRNLQSSNPILIALTQLDNGYSKLKDSFKETINKIYEALKAIYEVIMQTFKAVVEFIQGLRKRGITAAIYDYKTAPEYKRADNDFGMYAAKLVEIQEEYQKFLNSLKSCNQAFENKSEASLLFFAYKYIADNVKLCPFTVEP